MNITYNSINKTIKEKAESNTLLDVSIKHRIPHLHECGGHGKCTTCRVRILDGLDGLSPITEKEKETLCQRDWDKSVRLACQVRASKDVVLERLIWTSAAVSHLQIETVPENGEERPIAIVFCDIRDFTSISTKHPNFDLAYMLNQFYTILGEPILKNNGIIYQYVGDEIIGLFGAGGGSKEKNCEDAIRAALGMLYATEQLNRTELRNFGTAFKTGIGVHFGKAYLGHIGHPKHKQFAVLGDAMNLASRIQNYNKNIGTQLLISEALLNNFPPNALRIGSEAKVRLKGLEDYEKLFEVLGFAKPDINLQVQATLNLVFENEKQFAESFYKILFKKAPEAKKLFKNNLAKQGQLLTHMLSSIVYSFARPEHMSSGLKRLGKNHHDYGVSQQDYPLFKETLIETIKLELADKATPEMLLAWEQHINYILRMMKGR